MSNLLSYMETQNLLGDETVPLSIESGTEGEFHLADSSQESPAPALSRALSRIAFFSQVRINTSYSVQASLESFIARQYAQVSNVLAVYTDRSADGTRIYILLEYDDDAAMDSVFGIERWIYSRFPGEGLDFCVLPGRELEDQIPSSAVVMWKR
ncbi:MAG TPA: hypothetical protein VFJ52_05200 [Terriglobia bacterium]|nr:hypothetical protein [Terriglobia bacterium]